METPLSPILAVPPTNIEISGHHSGSRLEVKENEEVELRCQVDNARPKANIVWYRQSEEFKAGEEEYRTWYLRYSG